MSWRDGRDSLELHLDGHACPVKALDPSSPGRGVGLVPRTGPCRTAPAIVTVLLSLELGWVSRCPWWVVGGMVSLSQV